MIVGFAEETEVLFPKFLRREPEQETTVQRQGIRLSGSLSKDDAAAMDTESPKTFLENYKRNKAVILQVMLIMIIDSCSMNCSDDSNDDNYQKTRNTYFSTIQTVLKV